MPFPSTDYRRLVELSPDGILISRDDRVVFVNPAAVRLFGASAADELLGKSPFELFHPESHARIRELIDRKHPPVTPCRASTSGSSGWMAR